ncbi:MAG: hypothetical protein OEY94_06605 [Alphaproteobacteria bacterium]|nr:hypothetical protein [Alphaproteobacteria bacterium]
MGKEKIEQDQTVSKNSKAIQCFCMMYLYISTIIIIIFSAVSVYSLLYGYNKDGEYCAYTETMSNYHIILDGEPCLLQWQILIDFLFFCAGFLFLFQGPVWLLIFFSKGKKAL